MFWGGDGGFTSSLIGRTEAYGNNQALIGNWFKRTGKRDQVCSIFVIGFQRECV